MVLNNMKNSLFSVIFDGYEKYELVLSQGRLIYTTKSRKKKVTIRFPSILLDYNSFMGGTDKMDQINSFQVIEFQ